MPKQFVTSANAPTTGFTDLQKPPPIAQAISIAVPATASSGRMDAERWRRRMGLPFLA